MAGTDPEFAERVPLECSLSEVLSSRDIKKSLDLPVLRWLPKHIPKFQFLHVTAKRAIERCLAKIRINGWIIDYLLWNRDQLKKDFVRGEETDLILWHATSGGPLYGADHPTPDELFLHTDSKKPQLIGKAKSIKLQLWFISRHYEDREPRRFTVDTSSWSTLGIRSDD